jgi:hypothetical protein
MHIKWYIFRKRHQSQIDTNTDDTSVQQVVDMHYELVFHFK